MAVAGGGHIGMAQPLNGQIPANTGDILDQISPHRSSPSEQSLPANIPELTNIDIDTGHALPRAESYPNLTSSDQLLSTQTITIVGATVLDQAIQEAIMDTFPTLAPDNITFHQNLDGEPIIVFPVKSITFAELTSFESELTQTYIDNGYVTSGAFIPRQKISENVQIQVAEGEIDDRGLMIVGGADDQGTASETLPNIPLKYLSDRYVRSRLGAAIDKPLNTNKLRQALELLQLDPLITSIKAQLLPSHRSGLNRLAVTITEASPWAMALVTANDRSPSIGEWATTASLGRTSLITAGDRVNFNYGLTAGLDNYGVSYGFPLNGSGGRFNVSYSNSDSVIVEDEFRNLDIRSVSDTIAFNVDQPLHRTPSTEFSLGLGLDLRKSQTYLLNNIPFSFSQGPEEGRSKVTVLRFSQQWSHRAENQIMTARSQFNFGLDAFDATVNTTGTDGTFFSWLGQAQWVRQVSPGTIILGRLNGQLSPDSLLSLEQFNLGGVGTVRGYRQNQLVADNGVVAAIEARFRASDRLDIIPFLEWGTGWNNNDANPSPATIASLGLGLRWNVFNQLNIGLDYGIPLTSTDNETGSLQGDGLHFSVGIFR